MTMMLMVFGSVTLTSSSSNDTSSPYKSKVEDEVVDSNPFMHAYFAV